MKKIMTILALFTAMVTPVLDAGVIDTVSQYKKSLFATATLTAAGAAWYYAGQPGYDQACNIANDVANSDAVQGAYETASNTVSNTANYAGNAVSEQASHYGNVAAETATETLQDPEATLAYIGAGSVLYHGFAAYEKMAKKYQAFKNTFRNKPFTTSMKTCAATAAAAAGTAYMLPVLQKAAEHPVTSSAVVGGLTVGHYLYKWLTGSNNSGKNGNKQQQVYIDQS